VATGGGDQSGPPAEFWPLVGCDDRHVTSFEIISYGTVEHLCGFSFQDFPTDGSKCAADPNLPMHW